MKTTRICTNWLLPCLCAALFACGCARAQYADLSAARQAGAVLGESIVIDGADVSGLGVEQAEQAIRAAQQRRLEAMAFTVTAEGAEGSASFCAAALPVRFNTEAVLLEALQARRWFVGGAPRTFETQMDAGLEPLRAALSAQIKALERPAQDARAQYDAQAHAFVYTPERAGLAIDAQPLAQQVLSLLQSGTGGAVQAAAHELAPGYTLAQARADTAPMAEFSTSFAGKTYGKANRVFNIQKAAAMIDGAQLAPLEEFNMNGMLGARNGENGWRQATGIRDGAYVQEYGGGVCQVSSTLYNAVLMADLQVTERSHHSWPLGYVDVGRDATISTGGPNFKFKNTSGSAVTVSAFTEGKTITVRIYGRLPEDGRTIRLSSRKIKTLEDPGIATEVDPSLPPGVTETVREKRRGCIAETYKHYYDAAGTLMEEKLVTTDKYRSIKGLVRISAY